MNLSKLNLIAHSRNIMSGLVNYAKNSAHPNDNYHANTTDERDPVPADAWLGISIFKSGNHKANVGEWDEALLAWQNALKIFEETCGERSATVATTLNKIGVAYFVLKEPYYAYDSFKKALEIQEEILLPGDKELAMTLRNICILLSDTRSEMEHVESVYLEKVKDFLYEGEDPVDRRDSVGSKRLRSKSSYKTSSNDQEGRENPDMKVESAKCA